MLSFEDSLVVFAFCLFLVERSNESLSLLHGVRVPLLWGWAEERLPKEFYVKFVTGAAVAGQTGGWAVPEKSQEEFDSTRGYVSWRGYFLG